MLDLDVPGILATRGGDVAPTQVDDREHLHGGRVAVTSFRAVVDDRTVRQVVVHPGLPPVLVAVVIVDVPSGVPEVKAVIHVAAVLEPAIVVVDRERPVAVAVRNRGPKMLIAERVVVIEIDARVHERTPRALEINIEDLTTHGDGVEWTPRFIGMIDRVSPNDVGRPRPAHEQLWPILEGGGLARDLLRHLGRSRIQHADVGAIRRFPELTLEVVRSDLLDATAQISG